jgi:hypothetical protein
MVWRRATGLSGAKGEASRALRVPLTREGRQRKLCKSAGCLIPLALIIAAGTAGGVVVLAWAE